MLRLAPAAKHIRIVATAIVLTATGFLLLSYPSSSQPSSSDHGLIVTPTECDIVAQARLEQLQSRYNEEEVHREVGLKIGNPGWNEYVEELQGVYERFFQTRDTVSKGSYSGKTSHTTSDQSTLVQEIRNILADSLNLSARGSTHGQRDNSIPHVIHTTSKKREFPEQFSSWRRLNAADGWNVQYYDNAGIWRWMIDIFGRGSQSEAKETERGNEKGARILEEYKQLPSGVLRGEHELAERGRRNGTQH